MKLDKFFIRNLDADNYFENFLVSAIVSILVVRSYLYLTHFPHVGGRSLHIAHMLWGGLFMVIALIISMGFLSRSATRISVILGGIGFGVFIDELGKFITRDNNYFFQPTIAIIYIIFVLIYLLTKAIPRLRKTSQKEYLINALSLTQEAITHDMDTEEKKLALSYLRRCNKNDPLVKTLAMVIKETDVTPIATDTVEAKIRKWVRSTFSYLLSQTWFYTSVIVFIVAQSLVSLFLTFMVIAELNKYVFLLASLIVLTITGIETRHSRKILRGGLLLGSILLLIASYWLSLYKVDIPTLNFVQQGMLISTLISTIFAFMGLSELRHSKSEAYQLFRLSTLVSIFLTQLFLFYALQFYALIGLAWNIISLLTLQYLIRREESREMQAEE